MLYGANQIYIWVLTQGGDIDAMFYISSDRKANRRVQLLLQKRHNFSYKPF